MTYWHNFWCGRCHHTEFFEADSVPLACPKCGEDKNLWVNNMTLEQWLREGEA